MGRDGRVKVRASIAPVKVSTAPAKVRIARFGAIRNKLTKNGL